MHNASEICIHVFQELPISRTEYRVSYVMKLRACTITLTS